MAAGIQVPLLRHLVDPRTPFRRGFEVEGATIRLAAGAYDLGEGAPLFLRTKGMRFLGEEGVVIARAIRRLDDADGSGMINSQMMNSVRDADVRRGRGDREGGRARHRRKHHRRCNRGRHGARAGGRRAAAAEVHGTRPPRLRRRDVGGIAVIQDCILQNAPEDLGVLVKDATGKVTVTGTTIRRCLDGMIVQGEATIGKGCSITDCCESGIYAVVSHNSFLTVPSAGLLDTFTGGPQFLAGG